VPRVEVQERCNEVETKGSQKSDDDDTTISTRRPEELLKKSSTLSVLIELPEIPRTARYMDKTIR